MDDLAFVKVQLANTRRRDLPVIADATDVPLPTLIKIKYGTTKNPRWDTVTQVARYFKELHGCDDCARRAVHEKHD